MPDFDDYAAVYDRLYANKPYAEECAIVDAIAARYEAQHPRSLLDLGCGTGGHALVWARQGLSVCGADIAPRMLALARNKARREELNVEYIESEISKLETGRTWGRVVAMFAVVSYLAEPDDVDRGMLAVRRQLEPGGLFIFDVWYGSGMSDPPRDRVTRVHDEDGEIIKIATSDHRPQYQQVDVTFTVLAIQGDRIVERIEEKHRMRYFFPNELELIAARSGFELVEINACDSADEPPALDAWTARITFRATGNYHE